jgi:hypothetical protein
VFRAQEWRFIFEAIAQIRGGMAIRHAALLELAPDDETGCRAVPSPAGVRAF